MSNLEAGLSRFKENNPHCEIGFHPDNVIVTSPFGEPDTRFVFPPPSPEVISHLNQIQFNKQFDAIFHLDRNQIEFFGGFFGKSSPYTDRSFKFSFEGNPYQCGFSNPSDRLWMISRHLVWDPRSTTSAGGQLRYFFDFQNLAAQSERHKLFFQDKTPLSFFVKSEKPLVDIDIEDLARHINFVMRYYDRESVVIIIRTKNNPTQPTKTSSLRMLEPSFPQHIVLREIDDISLQLIEASEDSTPRMAFLYCYQVLEYAGFHYVDSKAKNSILKILRNPAFLDSANTRIVELFSILSETFHTDEVRIKKVIEELCDPRILWKEVNQGRTFFSSDLSFSGGFHLSKLIATDTTEESWCAMWTPKLFDQVTKIRNCLVHAREKRESKGILPVKENDEKIALYLPLIRRMAEQVAIAGIAN